MRVKTTYLCALCAALVFGLTTKHAVGQQAEPSADAVAQAFHNASAPADTDEAIIQAFHGASDAGETGDCEQCGFLGGQNVDLGLSNVGYPSRGQFYGGGEYLSVRATFSESVAFVANTEDAAGNETTTFAELNFDYADSYRAFVGYRLPECGGQIEFGFTNFGSSDAAVTSPPATAMAGDIGTSIAGPLAEITAGPGQSLQTVGSVDAQAFDLAFSKTIPLGSPPSCGGCCDDACGDCCGCGWCPAWDITWSGGLRYADVDWSTASTVVLPITGDPTITNSLDFNGFGTRFGLQGRRYIGRSQALSFFVKGDISLLLGDIDVTIVQDNDGFADSTANFSSTQIVPVTDIVAGATLQVTNSLTFSGGYLLSAWHDLGMRATTATDTLSASIADLSFDDANILGFDGFFFRGEWAF